MTSPGRSDRKPVGSPRLRFQGFVANAHIDLKGVGKDLAAIAIGSVSGGLGLVASGTTIGATVAPATRYVLAAGGAGALCLREKQRIRTEIRSLKVMKSMSQVAA